MTNMLCYTHINKTLDKKEVIVFLHEGLGCIKTWKKYPQLLCDELQMQGIVYDRAGYGESKGSLSNRTNDYLIEAADELYRFINSLQLKKVILYGHSDGGSIALAFGAKYPEQVQCLICEAAHVLNEKQTINGIYTAINAYKQGKLNGLVKWHGSKFEAVFDAWANTWLRPDFDLKSLKNLLPQVTTNQLVIQGKMDQYGTEKQYQTIAKLTKGETTIFIPDCGHAPFLESQTNVIKKVKHFIQTERHGVH